MREGPGTKITDFSGGKNTTVTTTAAANNFPINQESLQFDCWYKIWKLKVSQLKESVFENRVSRGLSIEQGSPAPEIPCKDLAVAAGDDFEWSPVPRHGSILRTSWERWTMIAGRFSNCPTRGLPPAGNLKKQLFSPLAH